MVGGEGLEPSSLAATDFKSVAYTNSATRPGGGANGIRTRVKGFADPCLTPRPSRHEQINYINTEVKFLIGLAFLADHPVFDVIKAVCRTIVHLAIITVHWTTRNIYVIRLIKG